MKFRRQQQREKIVGKFHHESILIKYLIDFKWRIYYVVSSTDLNETSYEREVLFFVLQSFH